MKEWRPLNTILGITYAGELIVRGIELRRHDTPNFIKEFQTEVLHTLFDYKNLDEVMFIGYERTLLLVTRTIDRIMTAEILLQDLVVLKLLGQGLDKYNGDYIRYLFKFRFTPSTVACKTVA